MFQEEGKWFHEKDFKKNYGLASDHEVVKILMKLSKKSGSWGHWGIIKGEFEKLDNKVHGWTQKALMGTFMGGLKAEISEGIQMFKPQSLKEVINLARMRDE